MERKRKTLNKTKINVWLDTLLALIFVIEMEEHFTGLPTHELLGLIFASMLIIHIILHWDWVVNITQKFFNTLLHESRVNYVLNAALLIDLVVITVTGIAISRTIGLNLNVGQNWKNVHIMASELSLILIGLHIAMHWKWIASNVGKYLAPRFNFKGQATVATSEVNNGTAS